MLENADILAECVKGYDYVSLLALRFCFSVVQGLMTQYPCCLPSREGVHALLHAAALL